MNDYEKQAYAKGAECFERGRKLGQDVATVSQAIDEFREAVTSFEAANQTLQAAVAMTNLGAHLVNRAWSPPNHVHPIDAADAEQVLSRVVERLTKGNDPSAAVLIANALAWRARARTLLAELDRSKNDRALEDARQAVSLLSSEPDSAGLRHDLALAHLHLSRAHFFQANVDSQHIAAGGWWSRLKWRSRHRADVAEVGRHSSEALRLDPEDRHIRIQASWLLENAERI